MAKIKEPQSDRFRLSPDARNLFTKLEKENKNFIKSNWDSYYILLMVGLAQKRKRKLSTKKDESFVEATSDFVKPFDAEKEHIISLLLVREMQELGISINEKNKDEVETRISSFLDTNNSSNLTPESVDLMNQYANGGYEVLSQLFPEKPEDVNLFFVKFRELVDEGFSS